MKIKRLAIDLTLTLEAWASGALILARQPDQKSITRCSLICDETKCKYEVSSSTGDSCGTSESVNRMRACERGADSDEIIKTQISMKTLRINE